MKPAISVQSLGKRYRLGLTHAGSIGAILNRTAKRAMRSFSAPEKGDGDQESRDHFWALRDLTFDVTPGEVLGIVGHNGAGKSTLLKILSRVTAPTEGSVDIYGRVGSLLEVGTGFHPEFTGRENVYLNGSLLGMTKAEIRKKFDEIVAFAEVEKFIDTPVKRYSSGMTVRLGFAVAAHLEPEILIVDEVLAVGDAAFQRKCLGTLDDVARSGRTVLFVSHNMGAVRHLCNRVVLLESGRVKADGPAAEIIDQYVYKTDNTTAGFVCTEPFDDGCRIREIMPENDAGVESDSFATDEAIRLRIVVAARGEISSRLLITIVVCCDDGRKLLTSGINVSDVDFVNDENMQERTVTAYCQIPKHFLNEGRYSLSAGVLSSQYSIVDSQEYVSPFEVYLAGSKYFASKKDGLVYFSGDWLVNQSLRQPYQSVEKK